MFLVGPKVFSFVVKGVKVIFLGGVRLPQTKLTSAEAYNIFNSPSVSAI